jgi:drug/metabolite transporter (DMT)-like permease
MALISAISNTFRDFVIKRYCSESPHLVVAATRFIALIGLLCFAPFFYRDLKIDAGHIGGFFLVLVITVILTIIATILKIDIIQKEDISRSSPLFALTPVFVLPWSFLLMGEKPMPVAFLGLALAVAGAFAVMKNDHGLLEYLRSKKTVYVLISLAIYGLTTSLDKIAIGYSSAYTYTLIWVGSSSIASLYILRFFKFREIAKFTVTYKNIAQAALWTVGFLTQQLAIQFSYNISMNAAYIKSISYIGVIINILLGGRLLKEKYIPYKLAGAATIILGNIVILFFAK